MRVTSILTSALLVSSLFVLPAQAGLLGNVLGGGGSSNSGTPSTSSSSGSSGTTTIGVPGVATVSLGQQGGTQVGADVLGGGGSTLNVGLSSVLGGSSNLGVTLPGNTSGATGGLAGTVNGLTGNGGDVGNLLGDVNNGALNGTGTIGLGGGGAGESCGLLGCFGGSGDGGTGGGGNGGGNGGMGGGAGGAGGGLMGSAGGTGVGASSGACIGNTAGIAGLLHTRYDASMMRGWNHAGSVRLIPLRLCSQFKVSLARAAANSGNIGFLRGAAAADPQISATLAHGRYNANNVIAVDSSGGVLSVYVF